MVSLSIAHIETSNPHVCDICFCLLPVTLVTSPNMTQSLHSTRIHFTKQVRAVLKDLREVAEVGYQEESRDGASGPRDQSRCEEPCQDNESCEAADQGV